MIGPQHVQTETGKGRALACRICQWLSRWIGAGSPDPCADLWAEIDAWERAHSNDWDLWCKESDSNRELMEQATAVESTDLQTAFQLFLRAADAGSVWAMQTVGWHYETGTYVMADFERAQEYYRRALSAGSWMATLSYARLLEKHGYPDYCDRVLEDGVQAGFVPSYFRLARFRYCRSKSRKTCRQIRPLLEYAAEEGHPGARRLLATLLVLGKYGLREIPKGYRMVRQCAEEGDAEEEGAPAPPTSEDVPAGAAAAR